MMTQSKSRAWGVAGEGWLAWGTMYCQPSSGHPDRFRYTKRAHTPRVLRIGSTFCAALDLDRSTWLSGGIQLCVQAVPHQAPFKTSSAGQFGPGCVCACPYQGASRGCWPRNGAKRFTSGRLSRAARLRSPHRVTPSATNSVRRGAVPHPKRLATQSGRAQARHRNFLRSKLAGNPAEDCIYQHKRWALRHG